MLKEKDLLSILIVASAEKNINTINEMFSNSEFSNTLVARSCSEAKQIMLGNHVDIVIIHAPLPDEYGIQFALDISHDYNVGILIIVKTEQYDQISYKAEQYGILCISRPCSRQIIIQSVRVLAATLTRINKITAKVSTLQDKMNEIRIVNRAKWILVERLKMTEPEAHRYIEKQAMDTCVKKIVIAENIINTYE